MTQNQTHGDDNASKLDPAEYKSLSYIASIIISKLLWKTKAKRNKSNEEIQTLLHAMKSTKTAQDFIPLEAEVDLFD